jgi:hypothetical protein
MKVIASFVLLAGLAGLVAAAQQPAQTSGSGARSGTVSLDQLAAKPDKAEGVGEIQPGSIIYADLDKSVDAKKAKVGDTVVAKIQQPVLSRGKIVAPKGAKILGHVTHVQARSKEKPQSELGIIFDRIALKDGKQIPVPLTLQAVGSSSPLSAFGQDGDASMGGPMANAGMPGRSAGPGILGSNTGSMSDVSASAGAPGDIPTPAPTARTGSSNHVSASSRGVVGISDITMAAQVGGGTSAQPTLLTSDKKNVKLDSGSELVLRVP